jgi:putative RNA 2'-phosphotransferase
MTNRSVKISKFLSLVLRHQPETIGITLSGDGWVRVDDLLAAMESHSFSVSLEELQFVVETNDKQRFSFSHDGTSIRANQGHSVEIDLRYEASVPPEILYHGTAEQSLASIRKQGLLKGKRHHVHLSELKETARAVGSRYGRPIVLRVASEKMSREGHLFFRSANGVWLTEHVPVHYIEFPGADE